MIDAHSTRAQWLIAAACGLVVATLLFPITSKPISWDELVYMNLAFFPQGKGWRLNRYAHIYALLPFVRIAGDPYVGTRLYWSCAVGLTTGLVLRTALAEERARRWSVVLITLLFLLAQRIVFAYPGIAYAEYTAMAATTAAFCLAWARLGAGGIRRRDAAMLGLLAFAGIKSTEFALPPLLLPVLFFVSASGRPSFAAANLRLLAWWIAGIAIGQLMLMALDGIILSDALFSLHPASWRDLLTYNVPDRPTIGADHVTLHWLLEPDVAIPFLVYALVGALWSRMAGDSRLIVLYWLPLTSLAPLVGLDLLGRLEFVPRYLVPVLPVLALLAAVALSRWMAATAPRRSARLVVTALVVASLVSATDVVARLARREVQRIGDARFAGFFEVARAVAIEPDSTVFVSERIYDGEIRPGVLPWLTRMNFNLRLRRNQMPSVLRDDVEYAVVSAEEQRDWVSTRGFAPADSIISTDARVALVCLRRACPHRSPP